MENPSRATGSILAYVYTGCFLLSISVQHFALLIRVCFMPSEDYLHSLALQKHFSGTLRMCLSKFLHLARGLFLYLALSTLLFFFFFCVVFFRTNLFPWLLNSAVSFFLINTTNTTGISQFSMSKQILMILNTLLYCRLYMQVS